MKIALIFGVFTLFAFAATGNANLIKKPGDLNKTAKFQKKLKEITDKIPEPIVLSDKNIQQNTENLELDVTLSGSISGIQNFTLDELILSILGGMSIRSFQFALPKLTVDIVSYDLDGKLGLTHIFGKGRIFLNLENIVLKGSAKLRIFKMYDTPWTTNICCPCDGGGGGGSGGDIHYAQITSVTSNLSLDKEKFNFKITGWLNDEYLSELLSNLINIAVKNMPPEVKTKLDEQISSILTKLVADYAIPTNDLLG